MIKTMDRVECMDDCDICDAYTLGHLDALDGKACRPEQYTQLTMRAEYLLGYDNGVDTLDYEQEFLDRLFWRRGEY